MRLMEERGDAGGVEEGEALAVEGVESGCSWCCSAGMTLSSIGLACLDEQLPEHSDSAVLTPAGCCSSDVIDIDMKGIWTGLVR